jgi:hypothetical protein
MKILRNIRYAYQKIRYGFSGRDLWSLDHTITDFVLPRLIAFRNGGGNSSLDAPSGSPLLEGYTEEQHEEMYEEWLRILDKMILAFEYHKLDMGDVEGRIDTDKWFVDEPGGRVTFPNQDEKWEEYKKEAERRDKIMSEGFALFAKYYISLWD